MARMVDLLEIGTQTLESIQNIFVAKVSLEMTQQSNSLAQVGGQLARVGAVFMPLTVITGMGGMNCKVPWQWDGEPSGGSNSWDGTGFAVVGAIMAIASLLTWHFVNRSSWSTADDAFKGIARRRIH